MPPRANSRAASRGNPQAPRKRARAGEPSSSEAVTFDSTTFVDLDAARRFEKNLHKVFIKEHGLDEQYRDALRGRHWEVRFFDLPPAGNETMAREFIANALVTVDSATSFVRGFTVDWSAATINAYYGIPEDDPSLAPETELKKWINEQRFARFAELLRVLTDRGHWEPSSTLIPRKFPKRTLLKQDRPHHYFIISRMHPTTNTSEITVERAEFLYAMRMGLSFNIGAVIHQSIRTMVQSKGKKLYGFASLITGLCLQAGVPERSGDVGASRGRILNAAFVARLDGKPAPVPALPAPEGEDTAPEGDDHIEEDATDAEHEIPTDAAEPSRPRARGRVPPAAPQWDERLGALEAQLAALQTSTTAAYHGIDARLDAMEARQSAFYIESSDFYAKMR